MKNEEVRVALTGAIALAVVYACGGMVCAGRALADETEETNSADQSVSAESKITGDARRFATHLPESVRSKWDKLQKMLVDAAVLRGEMEKLPSSSLFGDNKEDATEKINEILSDVREILLSSDELVLFEHTKEIKNKISELEAEIADYQIKRVGAPESSIFQLTKADCDRKIAEAVKEEDELNSELRETRAKIAAGLRDGGLNLSDEQIDLLFSSVVGDSTMDYAVIFANFKRVTLQLAELMAQNRSDTGVARKYYGMYITLIDVLLNAHYDFIAKITNNEWNTRLKIISKEASASLKEASAKLSSASLLPSLKGIYSKNVETNELTLKAVEDYTKLLLVQRTGVEKRIQDIMSVREAAVNTYNTVRHVGDLTSLIQSGLQFFDSLTDMQMPDLAAFDNSGVRSEFDEITKRLQEKG